MITTGPARPATNPINRKSDCFKKPEEKAMALGGVDMGKNKAVEADNPITTETTSA